MNTKHSHVIAKQKLEVIFKDRREGLGLQNKLALLYKEKMLPLFEMILDEHDITGYSLQIDKFVIDAGELPSKNWEKELVEKTVQQFKSELNTKLISPLQKKSIKEEEEREGFQIINSEHVAFNTFLRFLSTGSLPWNYEIASVKVMENEVLSELSQDADSKEKLRQLLFAHSFALERFLLQSSDKFIKDIMRSMGYTHEFSFHKSFLNLTIILQKMIINCLRLIWAGSEKGAGGVLQIHAPVALLKKALLHIDNKELISQIEGKFQQADIKFEEKELQERDADQQKKAGQQKEYYIHNSGLVILHPWLISFFTNLGYVNEQFQWKNKSAQQKALLLSQYLVSGNHEIAEFELPLNKILCGYPLEEPVERELILLPEEMSEAEKLLTTVIKHWSILKNTHIEGLRESFFRRDGKLTHTKKGWLLQVEQKAYDMLLNSLPWSITFIKNEMMEETVRVEWI